MLPSSRIETIAIHGGIPERRLPNEPLSPGIQMSTIYEHRKGGKQEGDLVYTRINNPNRHQLETLLARLEGGEMAAAFSSGSAAIAAVLQALGKGAHILFPDDVYYGTKKMVWEFAEGWSQDAEFVDMTDLDGLKSRFKENTKLVWAETPSNPRLLITDVKALAEIVHAKGALLGVDNTWPTPINMQPLALGADLVVHSTTKYLGGHSDLLGGAVVSKYDNEYFERIKTIQVLQGGVPSPFDCWLLNRSIRSLPYRMRAHNENAAKVAEFLNTHPNVKQVYFPGLKSHAGHDIAKRQMTGFGGMISFLVKGWADEAYKVTSSSKLITAATSLGGIESIWEHRKSSEGPKSTTPDNLIRLSVGLEHPLDLIADIEQALGQI